VPKREATRGYGAEVMAFDRFAENGDAVAERYARAHGMVRLSPFDHPHIMAGQGTVALELIEQAGPLDLLLVPVGGGGLLSGCATVARALNPDCRIVGVEPAAANDGQQSFRAGRIIEIAPPSTLADGAQTRHLGHYTFPVIKALADDIVTVEDAALVEAMKFFAQRMKLVVEPTGCLAAAAAFSGAVELKGQRVGVVLTGGNIDLARFASLVA